MAQPFAPRRASVFVLRPDTHTRSKFNLCPDAQPVAQPQMAQPTSSAEFSTVANAPSLSPSDYSSVASAHLNATKSRKTHHLDAPHNRYYYNSGTSSNDSSVHELLASDIDDDPLTLSLAPDVLITNSNVVSSTPAVLSDQTHQLFIGPLPSPSTLLPPAMREAVWSQEDVNWSCFFRPLLQTTLITFNPLTCAWDVVPGMKGLESVRPLPPIFYTPRFRGSIRPLSHRSTLVDAHIGGYLSLMTKGLICDSRSACNALLCFASLINSADNAYLGVVTIVGGHHTPDPSWIAARPHVRLVEATKDLTARYSSLSKANKPISLEPVLPFQEIFCIGYGSAYVMHQSCGMKRLTKLSSGTSSTNLVAPATVTSAPLTGNARLQACDFSLVPPLPLYHSLESHTEAIRLRNRNADSLDSLPLAERAAWDSWNSFLTSSYPQQATLSPTLVNYSPKEAMLLIVEFASTLLSIFSLPLSQVSTIIDKLAVSFQTRGAGFPYWFQVSGNPLLKQTYAAAKLTEAPLQRARVLALLEAEPLPIPLNLLTYMFEQYWVPGSWRNSATYDRRGYFLIVALGTSLGSRASNLCVGDLVSRLGRRVRLDHWLRCCDISYSIAQPPPFANTLIQGGNHNLRDALSIAHHLSPDDIDPSQWRSIQAAHVRCLTSKPTGSAGKRVQKKLAQPHLIQRNLPVETQLLDCLISFELARSIMGSDIPYFSRALPETGSILNLRTKEAFTELRLCADQLLLPDSHRYTPKSCRITLSTAAADALLPQETINAIGGWAPGSTISSSAYSRAHSVHNTASLFDRANALAPSASSSSSSSSSSTCDPYVLMPHD